MEASAQTWKNDMWCPRYKMTLIGHSLNIVTLETMRCILEVDISPLTQSRSSNHYAPRCCPFL